MKTRSAEILYAESLKMKIYRDIPGDKEKAGSVVTIGTFDGVHKGHREIISRVIEESEMSGLESCVVTFEPHPRTVVSKDFRLEILTTLDEKTGILESLGVDKFWIINFTKEFSSKSYDEFIMEYLVKGTNAKKIVIGYDHKFGKNRDGNVKKLEALGKENGFEVIEMSAVKNNSEEISSTKIRSAIAEGLIDKANNYLGRYYSISGTVVKGAQRGRTLGYPTANISPDDANKIVPKTGVYFTRCNIEGTEYFGMTNIGLRPTFHDVTELIIEVNIFNFNKEIYGKNLKIEFIERIREEIKFNSVDSLIGQIAKDKEECIKLIEKLTN